MNVLLISANTEQINMPVLPLGLAGVATAVMKAGHEVVMVDLLFETHGSATLENTIEAFRPEAIGISIRNIDNQLMDAPRFLLDKVNEVVTVCRSLSDAPIIVGGAGYSIFPEDALKYSGADMGIQGEGEQAFPALLERLAKDGDFSGIPGLYRPGRGLLSPRSFTGNLDMAPLPDMTLLSSADARGRDLWIPVQTRRGCPLNCSYCSTPVIEGAVVRQRAPEAVTAWLENSVKAGYTHFYFVDNTFNLPPAYARALCRRIIESELDIRWRCIVYPLDVDEELVEFMAAAGCRQVSLGFESGSEPMLKNMNKRFSTDDVRAIAAMFAEHGIERTGFLLLGGPGETKESVMESLAFADALDLEALKVTVGVRIYPHTPLAETAAAEGIPASPADLLHPRFYLTAGLEDWLPETLKEWQASRPHVMM